MEKLLPAYERNKKCWKTSFSMPTCAICEAKIEWYSSYGTILQKERFCSLRCLGKGFFHKRKLEQMSTNELYALRVSYTYMRNRFFFVTVLCLVWGVYSHSFLLFGWGLGLTTLYSFYVWRKQQEIDQYIARQQSRETA